MAEMKSRADFGEGWEGEEGGIDPATQGALRLLRNANPEP